MEGRSFGRYLAKLRDDAGFSNQDTAAEAIGVSRPTLARWETGKGMPSLEQAVTIASVYGVDVFSLAEMAGLNMPDTAVSGWAFAFARRLEAILRDVPIEKRVRVESALEQAAQTYATIAHA